jgi:glycosidase
MTNINSNNFLYQIFPLGACGADRTNNFSSPPVPRLRQIHGWLDHVQALGADTLFLGPVFESGSHGYDTANYYEVDRRLGRRADMAELGRDLRARGMRLVLDGVFNHTGRDFWAFRDLQTYGAASAPGLVRKCALRPAQSVGDHFLTMLERALLPAQS